MALGIDITRVARSRRAQAELVAAVRDAPTSEQETNWLEWKGTLDLSTKAAEAAVGRAVLGFANRDPDIAKRSIEGCAHLLVGVEPSSLEGVRHVDQASLEAGVNVYVGEGIDWHADYVEVDGNTVLVVTVEPPRWGDPIHPFRKAYVPQDGRKAIPEGTIFVRHTASTERASAADLDMLSRRAARRPGSELEVEVRSLPDTELTRVDCRTRTIDMWVANDKGSLMRALRERSGIEPWLIAREPLIQVVEPRSDEDYGHEVDDYAKELRDKLPGTLLARSVVHDLGRVQLEVVNRTDTTFVSVQVELMVPPDAGVCVWQSDARNREDLPERPAPYGKGGSYHGTLRLAQYLHTPLPRPNWLPRVQRHDDHARVLFDPVDVRAQGSVRLPSIWLMLNQDAPMSIDLGWEATAHGAVKRIRGTISLPVTERLAEPAELLADPDSET